VLMKHEGLAGEQVRLKITPEYGDKLPIYSNVCTVQRDQNTMWPDINVFNWEKDPANAGKYITKATSYNDWLEWLIYPYDSDRDLSTLDWSKAVDVPVFDNLEIGVYTVYARFKETEDYEAGTEIGYSKVVVGNYVEPTGTNILYNGKPVVEIIVKKGEEFELTIGPVPDNATLNSTNVTTWQPDTEKSNIIQYYTGRNGLYAPFNKSVSGRTIEFMAADLGYVTINAVTTLPNGSSSTEPITVRVVPDNYIPYTASVVNRGAEVEEGGSFTPQLALHARVEMLTERRASKFEAEDLLDSEIKTKLQSDTIKKQLRDRLTWALVNPIPQLVGKPLGGKPLSPYTESTSIASINTKTGEITLKDAAKPGNEISFVGILDDPYLGKITIPGSITVVAAPEPEEHTCDYEGYAVIEGNLTSHYRICECGKKKTEPHSFTEFASEVGDKTVIKNVCPCGISFSKTVSTPVAAHTHTLEYAYDDNEHWQICADEDCPDEYSSSREAHNFVKLYTDEDGKECNACSVCGCIYSEPEPDGAKETEIVNPYTDVKTEDWYYDDVMYVTDKKLMNGNNVGGTLFDPDVAAARAMIVTVLWRLEGSPSVVGTKFDDVASGQWYTDAVNWASANGIVNGYGNGKFGPSDPITREQLLAILHRYASHIGIKEDTGLSTVSGYKHSDWSKNSIAWALHNGLLDELGIDVSDLTKTATRAEIAAYLHRFCENVTKY